MIDQTPPQVQTAQVAAAQDGITRDQVPADLKAMLDIAISEGDPATVERVFGYARRARPDAADATDALHASYRQQVNRKWQEDADAARARLRR